MDVVRLGSVFRAVRLRLHLRQSDVARRAGVGRTSIGRIESGRTGSLSVETLMKVASSLEIQVDLVTRWRGGELTRMLNAGHAALHEAAAQLLAALPEWSFAPEVSFAVYGERGVMDILAYHAERRALLVIELKTQLVDVQGLLAAVDRYRRLAPRVAGARGWRATSVSVWVLLRESDTNRRRVADHLTVLRAAFPLDGWGMRRWLRQPIRPAAGLSFLSDVHVRGTSGLSAGVRRVRKRRASVSRA
jgi:transcriptional regulator with XRE-family HTH domain